MDEQEQIDDIIHTFEAILREGKKEQAFRGIEDALEQYPQNVQLLRATA